MKHISSFRFTRLVIFVVVLFFGTSALQAQTSQFTYQGRLTDAGSPASGAYDLQFRLLDALVGGSQVGLTIVQEDVIVANGIFSVVLDFGAAAFPGANRFLEISVRPGASTGAFTTLSPLQPILATPYAVRSLSAASASLADGLSVACINCVTSAQIGSVMGGQVAGEIPVTSVPAGSANYVQNTTTQQVAANFNISGNGTAGGTLSANIGNAVTQFNLNGSRALSNPGTNNLFVGVNSGLLTTHANSLDNTFVGFDAGRNTNNDGVNIGTGRWNTFVGSQAGKANTTGAFNAYFGKSAGGANTTGQGNAFFGTQAGNSNTTGTSNSFFGSSAGFSNLTSSDNTFLGSSAGQNTTTGYSNTFVGRMAGANNDTGFSNTFIGRGAGATNTSEIGNTLLGFQADVAAGIMNATALGIRATVTQSNSLVLGAINGLNGATADTKVGIGTTAPTERLSIVGNLKISGQGATGAPNGIIFNDGSVLNSALNLGGVTTVTADAPLTSSGGSTPNLSLTGTVPVANGGTNLSSAGSVGNYLRSNGTTWTSSPLLVSDLPGGNGSYIQNTTTQQASANFNISGNGTAGGILSASSVNATTQYNLNNQRMLSAAGTENLFIGYFAGQNNTTGEHNTNVGVNAGGFSTTSGGNSIFGAGAGAGNTGENNSYFGAFVANGFSAGSDNSFFGLGAGFNIAGGSRNAFFGTSAGASVTTGSDNVFIGRNANGTHPYTGSHNTLIGTDTVLTGTLSYATAIGAEASVASSNTIALGRGAGQDSVKVYGKLIVGTLSAATATHLCINGSNELSACSSSLRYKQNIEPLVAGLNLIQQLRPVSFTWKESKLPDLGLIAEEVAAVEPLLVTHNPTGAIEGVKYDQLSVVLINAIKEQQALIEQQQSQLKAQRQELDALKKLICAERPRAEFCQIPKP